MRWDLYVDQTLGAGSIALAIFVVCFGIFSWWYIIQRLPWLEPWREKLIKCFWSMIVILYVVLFYIVVVLLAPTGG